MRIVKIDTCLIEIPFGDFGPPRPVSPSSWHSLETVLVRLEDEYGNVGWGEGFGYFVADATKALIDRLIAPLLLDQMVEDIPAWNQQIQQRLHLFGRYGVTLFAVSGVDMALWDLRAQREGLSLAALLANGGAVRETIPAYASLVRYGNSLAPRTCERALKDGFCTIKLHETHLEDITACRRAIGYDVPLATDVNCSWTIEQTKEWLPTLAELGLAWLEEPIFPPEDYATLASLRGQGVPLSAGENWCTEVQFAQALQVGAVDSIQPSVTKVGGVSECVRIGALAAQHDAVVLPHSPYFGPGLLATLHLAAAQPWVQQVEYHYVEPAAWLYDVDHLRDGGRFRLPEGTGLGMPPNLDVVAQFKRS